MYWYKYYKITFNNEKRKLIYSHMYKLYNEMGRSKALIQ